MPVIDVSPTFSVLLTPLNWAIRHRWASFESVVSSVCIPAAPEMYSFLKLPFLSYRRVKMMTVTLRIRSAEFR
jgi:hypothetical protein